MWKVIVIFVCCVALSACAETCPDEIGEKINVTAYVGRWYPVLEAGWPSPNCSFVEYSELNTTTLTVRNSSVGAANDYEHVQGFAHLPDGKHFSLIMADNYSDNYYVMATDYASYTVLVACDPSAQNISVRALVLGRERNLTDDSLDATTREKLTGLEAVGQGECPNAAPAALLLPPLGLLLAALVTWHFL